MKYANNPGNIRYSADNNWVGQIQPRNGFCEFGTMKCGIRAACIIIFNYRARYGLKSVKDLIWRWAPPVENDTASYTNFVTSAVAAEDLDGVKDVFKSPHTFLAFMSAIFFMETNYRLTGPDEATVMIAYQSYV